MFEVLWNVRISNGIKHIETDTNVYINLFLLYYVQFLGHYNCMQVKDMLNSRKTTSIHYYAIRGINEAVHFGS